jgi:hypothetical protein
MPARIAREFLTDIFWHWRNATERERERECVCVFRYVHPYLERHQELSQKLLLHPRLLQQLCKKQQTLCHPACSSQSANRKTKLLFLRWLSEKNQIHISMARMGLFSYF